MSTLCLVFLFSDLLGQKSLWPPHSVLKLNALAMEQRYSEYSYSTDVAENMGTFMKLI